MKELIRQILKEEVSNRAVEGLLKIRDELGLNMAMKAVGGLGNFVRIVYGTDIKKFFKDNNVEPYHLSSEPNLYIDDLIVQELDLPNANFTAKNEKRLGDFSWVKGGIRYRFSAVLYPIEYASGKKQWRVIGLSGDSGFGYSFITKRNTLGKKARMQIFQQIIDKYNLDSYK